MFDIVKCTDHECPVRLDCLRYDIQDSEDQFHADFEHNKLFGSCDYFIRLPKKKNNK